MGRIICSATMWDSCRALTMASDSSKSIMFVAPSSDGEAVERRKAPRVAQPELDRMVADVAVAAQDLHRIVGDLERRARRVVLREHRFPRRQEASQASRRMASISIAMSASLKAIACFCAIACPNARRSFA